MSIKEKIKLIESIVCPYYIFNTKDFYDNDDYKTINIEDITIYFFKLIKNDKYLSITQKRENEIIKKIMRLNIGHVDVIKVKSFGRYITVSFY